MKKLASGRIERLSKLGMKLAKATGKIAKSKLSGGDEQDGVWAKIEASKEVIDAMGELKGAFMKIGQMLSLTEDMLIPDEVSVLFKKLQKEAPPMTMEELHSVFMDEFNCTPEKLFSEFDPKPMAAASIGQVHKARLTTGEEVAVKVQYPGIQKAIKNDFKNVNTIERVFKLLIPNLPDIRGLVEEMSESIIRECDYSLEAQEAIYFKKELEKEFSNIKVPKVFEDFSSPRILTMELMKGDSFEETLSYSQKERNTLGQTLFDCYMFTLYKLKRIHSDPQNGNYLFGPGTITILDFGSTKKFSDQFVLQYLRLLLSIEQNDLAEYRNSTIELGLCLESDSETFFKEHLELVGGLYRPYQREGYFPIENDVNPFKNALSFIKGKSMKGRAPMRDLVMLDRSTLGLFTKLKAWQSKINWVDTKEKYRGDLVDKARRPLAET